ncbi:MAG: hypothetical protein ACFFER_20055 [Candidatus Thorarchaeota archaeon]
MSWGKAEKECPPQEYDFSHVEQPWKDRDPNALGWKQEQVGRIEFDCNGLSYAVVISWTPPDYLEEYEGPPVYMVEIHRRRERKFGDWRDWGKFEVRFFNIPEDGILEWETDDSINRFRIKVKGL